MNLTRTHEDNDWTDTRPHITQRKPDAETRERITAFELFDGHARLFILGPGPRAWFPVTAPNTGTDPHSSPEERKIADHAIQILNSKFYDRHDIGPKQIRRVLVSCGWIPDELTIYDTEP